MTETNVSCLSEFINTVETINKYYPSGMLLNNPASNHFVYRGLCNSSFPLLPSVFRKTVKTIDNHTITNDRYLAWNKEKGILQAFIQEASGILSIPPNDLFHWAEYAQHYGAPTRFLDWSSNPLVALYFACRKEYDQEGTVWILHRDNYYRFTSRDSYYPHNKATKDILADLLEKDDGPQYPVLYTPYYVDTRMSVQKSFFLAWGMKKDSFEDMVREKGLFMDIPEDDNGIRSFGVAQREDLLFRVAIPADRKRFLLRELDMVGINESSLFPGLDGIGRYIEGKYSFDYDEAVSQF